MEDVDALAALADDLPCRSGRAGGSAAEPPARLGRRARGQRGLRAPQRSPGTKTTIWFAWLSPTAGMDGGGRVRGQEGPAGQRAAAGAIPHKHKNLDETLVGLRGARRFACELRVYEAHTQEELSPAGNSAECRPAAAACWPCGLSPPPWPGASCPLPPPAGQAPHEAGPHRRAGPPPQAGRNRSGAPSSCPARGSRPRPGRAPCGQTTNCVSQ